MGGLHTESLGTDFQIAWRNLVFGNMSKGFNMYIHCIDLDADIKDIDDNDK